MRLLHRGSCSAPRAKTIRAAESYLVRGAEEARSRGHNYVGTEHVLLGLIRNPRGGATKLLRRLGVDADAVEDRLASELGAPAGGGKIDADALATLGIDLATVRERLERTFGPGALERTDAACLGVAPRLKVALAHAIDQAGGQPLADEHVLLGLLSVPDSVAARLLGELGVSLLAAQRAAS